MKNDKVFMNEEFLELMKKFLWENPIVKNDVPLTLLEEIHKLRELLKENFINVDK